MKIDIIMPHYNGLQYLEDAIKSICLGLLSPNDLSDKESFEICAHLILVLDNNKGKENRVYNRLTYHSDEEYKELVTKLLIKYSSPSLTYTLVDAPDHCTTVGELRNIGLSYAGGDYIYYLDSDDYLFPGSLYDMASVARSNDYCDLVTGPIISSGYKLETALNTDSFEIESTNIFDNMVLYNFTALHLLIKNEERLRISFNEENDLYPDVYFTPELLSRIKNFEVCPDALYMKRISNDTIRYPSVDQLRRNDRMELRDKAYRYILSKYQDQEIIQDTINKIHANEADARKKELKRKIKAFLKRPVFMYRMIEKYLIRKLPMKNNYVVFESFRGKAYSDSCKYIYEYMYETYGSNFKYIWVINDKKAKIPGKVKKVTYLSPAWFYYTSRAKYYINNVRQSNWMNKRPGAIFLECWHGTPLKRLVFDMDEVHSATATHKSDFYHATRKWDYLISDNPFSTEKFESCFLLPKEKIIETGYPRNDLLFADNKEAAADNIKEKLGIPKDKKVILYAPTWRDDQFYESGKYQFALKLDLKNMQAQLGDDHVLLLRTHYYIADSLDISDVSDFAYDVSRYDDVTELYLISDICITDYSSVFFDYAGLKRPILFYVYDYENYKNKLRGFYIDMETELPGPLLYTENEVISSIKHIDAVNAAYKERYDTFYKRFCSLGDGHASKRVVDIMLDEQK